MISLHLPRLPEIWLSSSSSPCQDLGLAKVFGGFLVAAGASKQHNWFRLPVRELRPKDWLAEAHPCSKQSSRHRAKETADEASITCRKREPTRWSYDRFGLRGGKALWPKTEFVRRFRRQRIAYRYRLVG